MDKISIIINKVEKIIEESKERKELVFNIDNIKKFINLSVTLIFAKIKELNL